MRTTLPCVAAAAAFAASGLARAQCSSAGPDAAVSEVVGIAAFGSSGGIAAFSVGATMCNLGDTPLPYGVSAGGRPLIAPGLFRLTNTGGVTRFEQIGLGWVFNTFASLNTNACCGLCSATNGNSIGAHCSCPESASFLGTPSSLGPRFGLNAATGSVANPTPIPPASGALGRRLQAAIADIDPAQNPGATYFVELQTLTTIESGVNRGNNTSFRRCAFNGVGQDWTMALQSTTSVYRPVINAWKDADASVVLRPVSIPGDGEVILAGRATPLPGGLWRYEYAVQNVTSDRSVRSISVPVPPDVTVSNAGFHDVHYHSGDGLGGVTVDGTDWTFSRLCAAASWQTQTFAQSQNANALRWGTVYNVRFTADSGPTTEGTVVLGLYRPGADFEGWPTGLPAPRSRVDVDGDGQRTPADVAAFVNLWFAGLNGAGLAADFDRNGQIQPADVAGYLNLWFSPPGC